MQESYIQNLFAQRIGGKNYGKDTNIYKFEKIKRAKERAKAVHPDVPLIDMGVGEPDAMADNTIIQSLQQAAERPQLKGYADNGGAFFLESIQAHMENFYGVTLDAQSEILHSIGSKAALSILPKAFINPGDITLTTTPGYPIFSTQAAYLGGKTYQLPLLEENNFLPVLEDIPQNVLQKAKVLVLNYPNNPTGSCASEAFFKEAVEFAKKHELIIIQDAAYAMLCFGEQKPLSILQIEGAKDVAVELHSLSKSYNMTGWRLGWVCGNPLIVKAYGDLKDNTDSGQFLAIQQAGTTALAAPEISRGIKDKYERRMDLLVEALTSVGFEAKKSAGTFFLYTQAPKQVETQGKQICFSSGEEFSQWLIEEKLISTVPWDDAGGYIRFSVTFDAPTKNDEEKVISQIKERLKDCTFVF